MIRFSKIFFYITVAVLLVWQLVSADDNHDSR